MGTLWPHSATVFHYKVAETSPFPVSSGKLIDRDVSLSNSTATYTHASNRQCKPSRRPTSRPSIQFNNSFLSFNSRTTVHGILHRLYVFYILTIFKISILNIMLPRCQIIPIYNKTAARYWYYQIHVSVAVMWQCHLNLIHSNNNNNNNNVLFDAMVELWLKIMQLYV